MPSNIRCITFDLDDTLWNCAPVIERAERHFYDWLDVNYPRVTEHFSFEDMIDHRVAYMRDYPEIHHNLTKLRKQWLAEIAREVGYDDALVNPGFDVFWRARNQVEVFREALDALESLSSVYRIGAITNGNADVHHIGIGHHFDFVVRSEEAGFSKPDPNIFSRAVELAGCGVEEIVHVGDDPERDVSGAKSVGMRTVWVNARGVPWPGGEEPDATIRGLDDLEEAVSSL